MTDFILGEVYRCGNIRSHVMSHFTDGINIQQFGDGFDWPFNLVRLSNGNFLLNFKNVG